MKTIIKYSLIITFLIICRLSYAQEQVNKKLKVNGLVVGRYITSLNDNIDINGKHFNSPESIIDNSFIMQYVRIKTTFSVNKKIRAVAMVNLADFKNNTQTKVLELAFIDYKMNPYLNFRFGQFRPYFGLEDRYAYQLEHSWRWSDQYLQFGKSNWMSFQIGAAITGSLKESNIPLNYFFTVYNGNGKNQLKDDDNSKNYAGRIEYYIFPQIRLGTNYALSDFKNKKGYAFGFDMYIKHQFNDFTYLVLTEYKKGSNLFKYKSDYLNDSNINISNYNMEGFYFSNSITKKIKSKYIEAIDLDFRYEYIKNLISENNTKQIYTPMLSVVLKGDYDAVVSLAYEIARYKNEISNSSVYNSNRALVQFQVSF